MPLPHLPRPITTPPPPPAISTFLLTSLQLIWTNFLNRVTIAGFDFEMYQAYPFQLDGYFNLTHTHSCVHTHMHAHTHTVLPLPFTPSSLSNAIPSPPLPSSPLPSPPLPSPSRNPPVSGVASPPCAGDRSAVLAELQTPSLSFSVSLPQVEPEEEGEEGEERTGPQPQPKGPQNISRIPTRDQPTAGTQHITRIPQTELNTVCVCVCVWGGYSAYIAFNPSLYCNYCKYPCQWNVINTVDYCHISLVSGRAELEENGRLLGIVSTHCAVWPWSIPI